MKNNKYEIDMVNGSIMDKLISFALPLMISGILQLAFNAVDIIVVGQFSGSKSLAAVGQERQCADLVGGRHPGLFPAQRQSVGGT